MSAVAAVGLAKGVMKGLFSPVGLTVLSCLLIFVFGINPLILIFDLIVKSMNILSGNALINSIIYQTFDPSSPIFIIYITIFVISFILIFFKLIKGGLSNSTNAKEFSNSSGGRAGAFSMKRMKWIAIWLLSFFLMPFAFGIILFIIQLFSSLFGIQATFAGKFTIFNETDWNTAVGEIRTIFTTTHSDVDKFLNFLFPADIGSQKIPVEFEGFGITDQSWQDFLKGLQTNTNAMAFKDGLLSAKMQIKNILALPIFRTSGAAALNLTVGQTASMVDSLTKNIDNFLKFFNNSSNVPYNQLQLAIATVINDLPSNDINMPLKDNDYLLLQTSNWIQSNINNGLSNIGNNIGDSKLNGIKIYGLENQKIGNTNSFMKLENLTIQISSALYQQPIYSIFISNRTIWTSFLDWNKNIETVIATFGFTFCFTTFWSLILILAEKLFSYVALLMIAPFATSAGVNDAGEKFQLWFKTIFGKCITIFIVSLSVSIFAVVLWFAVDFFSISNVGTWFNNSTDAIWYGLLSQFILIIVVIGSCSGLLEFVGWSATLFNFDLKAQKYRNNFTQRRFAPISNSMSGLDKAQQTIRNKERDLRESQRRDVVINYNKASISNTSISSHSESYSFTNNK